MAFLTIGIVNNSYALPPYLSILIPNSNTNWVKGNNVSIIWTDNISNNVVLKLYKGNTFITKIAGSTPSDGSHSFTVPTNLVNGNDYRVHIAAIGNPGLSDYSSSFSITGPTSTPSITITNPTSGTVWNKGQTVSIQWTDNITGHVGIELYKGGTAPIYTVVSSTASDGSHTFTVPTNLVNGTNYQVHMYEINNTTNQASSPLFTITGNTPYINITNPNSNTTWSKGQTIPIQWTDNISHNVRIQLFRGNTFVSNIAYNTASDGSHNWSVPTGIPNASNYRVKIFSLTSPSISDFSDYFTINSSSSTGSIVINRPLTGDTWVVGQTVSIQWADNIATNVKIELYKGFSLDRTIATSTPSDGLFTYFVPINLANASNYRIKISSIADPSIVDISDFFSINTPTETITITNPSASTTWIKGQTRTIQWNDNISSNVRIELYKGSILQRTIATSTPSDGFHTYNIPTNLVPGTNYRVRIASVSNPSVIRFSSFFTINSSPNSGAIIVDNPTTNTVWIKGQTRPIQWTDNITGNVKIELYRENTRVATLFGSTPSDGLQSYVVSTFLTNSNRYRIRISDVNNASIFDFSDYFTITSFISIPNYQRRNGVAPNTTKDLDKANVLEPTPTLSILAIPNPQIIGTSSQLIIKSNDATPATIILSDITGKIIQEKSINLQKGNTALTLESPPMQGVYLVSIQTAKEHKSLKLVVGD